MGDLRVRDLAFPALLAALLAGVLLFAGTLPQAALAFPVDRQPGPTILRNFYGLERNANGAYRWSKPEAVVSVPVNAPGTYRLALTLGGGAGRTLALYANGEQVGSFIAGDAPQDYVVTYTLPPRRWATDEGRMLTIEWQVATLVPPGDSRALGMILYDLALTPVEAGLPERLLFLAPNLLLLLLAYAALRFAGLSARATTLLLGGTWLGLAAFALLDRGAALFWSYQAAAQPGGALVLAAGLVLLPVLVRATAGAAAVPAGARAVPSHRAGPSDDPNFWSRASWPILPILLLGGALRVLHYDRLGLWFDEGATIRFAKQPWPKVLGLHGAYDFHPPLYYTLVKLATLVAPPQHAGRLVSVALGTLTIGLLYALAVRLLDRRAAIFAALALAVSPLHLWFSQEARMYVPSVFLVGWSYLAIVAFVQATTRRARWGLAALYATTAALAMYFVYSSLYGLLPQLLIFGYLIAGRDWRRRLGGLAPLLLGGLIALLAYLPWVPELLGSVAQLGDRSKMLAPTPPRVRETILALLGPGSLGTEGGSYYLGLWHTQPAWRTPMFLALTPLVILGVLGLVKRSALAALVALALLGGTIVATILASSYSPGYAARTILAAALGWALLGGAGASFDRPRGIRLLHGLSFACLLALSLGTIQTMQATGYRQHYREAVAGAAGIAPTGYPIVPVGYLAAFFDAYAPDIAYVERDYLQRTMLRSPTPPDAFWIMYGSDHHWDNLPALWRSLDALGYRQLLHHHYGDSIYLDLVALPGARFGAALPVPAGFPFAPGSPGAWQGRGEGVAIGGDAGGEQLALAGGGAARPAVWLDIAASGEALYVLSLEAAGAAPNAGRVAAISCLTTADETLALSSPARVPIDPAPPLVGPDWQPLSAAVVCPAGTARVRVQLEGGSAGTVRFRRVGVATVDLARPDRGGN